jgi:hypothetical protein
MKRGRSISMKSLILAAVAALAIGGPAKAIDSQNDWVMLELYWANGEGAKIAQSGLVPEFPTRAACQAALRRELLNHAGLSHAEGGGNLYLCTPLRSWSFPE